MRKHHRKTVASFLVENIRPHGATLGGILMLLLGGIVTELLKPWPLKFVIDYLTAGSLDRHISTVTLPEAVTHSLPVFLLFIAGAILFIAVTDGVLRYYQTYLQKRVGSEIVARIRSRLFSHIQRLSLRFHYSRRTGEIVNRITQDTGYLETVFSESVSSLLKGILQIAGMAAIMLWMDWQMMLVALMLTPLLFWITVNFTRKIKKASRTQRRREGNLASIAQETISSIKVVKAYSREGYSEKVFENESLANLKASLAATHVEAKFMPVVQTVTAFGIVVVVCFGIYRVQAGILSPGDLWVFLSYLQAFYRPLKILSKQLHRLVQGQVRLEKIVELLQIEDSIEAHKGAVLTRVRGDLEFREVRFGYSPAVPVLNGITLQIRAGEKIAIVGPTGSGKSTLVSLLARLYDPTAGQILIDGRDIREFNPDSLREQISFVLQETLLFRTTIKENIAYGRLDASFDEIVEAAKRAKIHEYIMSLPDGYNTVIGERGITLSGGQRQRLAIARAVLRKARIIILDEPTTGLDPATEAELWQELKTLIQGKTTILISHQHGLALDMDRVYYLNQGQLQELSSHLPWPGVELVGAGSNGALLPWSTAH
ncbi:MAG: ABC transporter ATP-binding protein [Calditrichaeota bacterium]|nr:MAG: ABC transporter ATP-binding protein [Calditrichota bacterium]